MLAQHANDLILGKSASPHHSSPSDELTYQWHDFWGAGQTRRLLEERTIAKHYVGVISMRGIFFEATERALRDDIKRLDRRIRKLVRERRAAIQTLNKELSFEGTELAGIFHPRWPENRYHRGRLTPRGVEICYRLFDIGKSSMAVAHIMELSLSATRARERQWRALGGESRPARDLDEIPAAHIPVRYEDMR
jgi:hypothetical protein